MKLAARWVSSLDGVFINDLHELSAHILEDPTSLRLNPDQVLGGSNLGTSMATSPGDITMMVLDLAD